MSRGGSNLVPYDIDLVDDATMVNETLEDAGPVAGLDIKSFPCN
jgi:hypothetical protein